MHNSQPMRQAIAIANAIWELAEGRFENPRTQHQFPRDIESLAICSLEIPVVRLPVLTLQKAANYLCILRSQNTSNEAEIDARSLYGLLHVGPPANVIFLQEDLSPLVANYILAHELGHFMGDVFSVRRLWLVAMPEQKAAIQRMFSWKDFDGGLELSAVIKGLPMRPETITGRGERLTQGTTDREILADLTARELLAPWNIVAPSFQTNQGEMITSLRDKFGLPGRVAIGYYDDLQHCLMPNPNLVDRLFAPLLRSSPENPQKN